VAEQQQGCGGGAPWSPSTGDCGGSAGPIASSRNGSNGELAFYVKGMISDRDLAILRKNLINIARAERRRRG